MANSNIKQEPKRVILRLRVADFEKESASEFVNAIQAYLNFAGYNEDVQYYSHIEPFQSPEIRQLSFHIILDIHKDKIQTVDFNLLPHEVYRVRRKQDKLYS